MRPEVSTLISGHLRGLAERSPVGRALAELGAEGALEFYIAGRCPGGGPRAGQVTGYDDPNCGRRDVKAEDRIMVHEPTSNERYVLYSIRNKPERVTKKTGSAEKYHFSLWNGWEVTATRLQDGYYKLSIDKSGGSPGDKD